MAVNLPAPDGRETRSLAECISSRRSLREYSGASIPISYLSELLWSAQGITGADGMRTTPSAAALYPLHLHVLARRVVGLEPGIYEYRADDHSLQLLGGVPAGRAVEEAGIGDQPWLTESAILIGVAADLAGAVQHFGSQPPEGERGKRYVYMESGALAQNVHLYATALEVGCVLVGGFDDFQAREMLRLSQDLEPTALICIGCGRRASKSSEH